MRIYRLVSSALISSALGGVFVAASSTAAFAGCGVGVPVQNCNPRLVSQPVFIPTPAPIHIYGQQPYGYLKQFAYKSTPNVNIMRLHGRAPLVSLRDHPIAFTGGCTPSATVYCRAPQVLPAPMPVPMPMPTPYIAPPAPIAMPQQYGQANFAMNTAHISAPAPSYSGSNGYWEKASGPALIDGLPVSQILCRRAAPRPAPINVRVVRPVIGVPIPVPTPIAPVCNPGCAPTCAGGAPRGSRYGNPWTY